MIHRLIPVLLFFIPLSIYGQTVASWSAYPSLANVKDISAGSGGVWVATEGGVYFWHESGQVRTVLTPLDGLYQANPSKLLFVALRNELWMGFSDGMLQVFRIEDSSFTRMADISRVQQFTRRDITTLSMKGDSLVAGCGFGIVVIDPARKIVIESYTRFASLTAGLPVLSLWIDNGTYFAATADGLVRNNTAQNLFVPASWSMVSGNGLPAGSTVTAVYAAGGQFLATAGSSTYAFTNNTWTASSLFAGSPVTRFIKTTGGSVALSSQSIYLPDNSFFGSAILLNGDRLEAAGISDNGDVLAGTFESGMLRLNSSKTAVRDTILPNGPSLNAFAQLDFRDGLLASASSASPGATAGFVNTGYYLLQNGIWENRNLTTDTTLKSNNFNAIHKIRIVEGQILFGSFGRGFGIQNLTSGAVSLFNHLNSPLTGLPGAPGFIVVTGLDRGPGTWVWITTLLSPTAPLSAFNVETKAWKIFGYPAGIASSNEYSGVLNDSYGQLWIPLGTAGGGGNGILVFSAGTIENDADNRFVHLTEVNANLPSPRINAVKQDKRGEIWIGTSRGVARFLFPELIIEGGAAEQQAQWLISEENGERFFFLRDLHATSMAVNAANQKWIGSADNGLWLVDESGSSAIHHFTRENSPLISNNIQSLAMDEATGTLFIATDLGLSSFVDVARETATGASGLFVYPNPYSYSRDSGPVIIDRLPQGSLVQIVTVDGTLIRRFEANSSRVSWDAKDGRGRKLSTGVYFVIASDKNGGKRITGKVLIQP